MTLEGDAAVGQHGLRGLGAGIVGDAFRRAAFCGYQEDVLAAFTPGAEVEARSVGGPNGIGIVGCVAGNLQGSAALCVDDIEVALVRKSDPAAIGRDGIFSDPAGVFLRHRREAGGREKHNKK